MKQKIGFGNNNIMKHTVLKKHLVQGSVIPIFLNWQKQQNFRGNAILIKRLEEREPSKDEKTYEFDEIGSSLFKRKHDKVQILYNYEWWLIKFIDGPEKGFQTAVKIAYYQKTFWQKEEEE